MWRNAVPTTWQQKASQHIVKREQIENNMVQLQIEAAEQSLARLQLAAAPHGVEHEDEESEVSDCVSQSGLNSMMEASWGNSVSFSGDYHPEDRQPIRRGTPTALPTDANGYLADDEGETPRALRRKTRGSPSPSNVSCLTLLLPTPSPLQSPVLFPRPLKPSEVWDEAPAEPIYAPVPLRPLIKPELLLVGYFEEPNTSSDPTFLKNSRARTMDQRLERLFGLLDDLKKIHKDLDSFLGHR